MNEKIKRGRFVGIRKDGIDIFRGITFARYERFREAVPDFYEDGQEEIDATTWGPLCPQLQTRYDGLFGENVKPQYEEGRLCLSVYAPEVSCNLPVMVWIHGGSYVTGGSEEHRYSAERLVKAGNVIVVKISYRLGALGYLYLPGQGICNLGLKDQKTALEWVSRMIGIFGGDPDRITVCGQSAGAQSIAAIIATSREKPLFRRAIIQSPPLGIGMMPKKASQIASAFCKCLGKNLQEASTEEILQAQKKTMNLKIGMAFMPVIEDFTAIPECVANSGLEVVAGYAKEDGSPFVKSVFKTFFDTFAGRIATKIVTRAVFSRPILRYIARLRNSGIKTYGYFIFWHPKGNPMGACHCIELPFLLGDKADWEKALMMEGFSDEEFSRNSKVFLKAWTDFAVSGKFNPEEITGNCLKQI